jgi:hypothetical protein
MAELLSPLHQNIMLLYRNACRARENGTSGLQNESDDCTYYHCILYRNALYLIGLTEASLTKMHKTVNHCLPLAVFGGLTGCITF